MRTLLRIIVTLMVVGSVLLGALVYVGLTGKGATVRIALIEAMETIPEGLMIAAGLPGSPIWLDVAYWAVLLVLLVAVWRWR